MLKPGLLFGLIIFINMNVFGQKHGYHIEFKINKLPDTICYLAHYYGDKTYADDTAKTGRYIVFTGEKKLPDGIYILAGQKNKIILEFIIHDQQELSFEADYNNIVGSMSIKKSQENVLFYDYLKENSKHYSEIEKVKTRLKATKDNSDSLSWYKSEIERINQAMEKYKKQITDEFPGSFLSKMILAMQEPELPPLMKELSGPTDSLNAYLFRINHYWEGVDFEFEGLMRTPVFHKKIEKFFTQVVVQHPDSIIIAADRLIEKSKVNKEFYKYCIWFITNKYELSNIMGFDKIFVHQVKKYYKTGEAYWADTNLVKSITTKAEKIEKTLIGHVAPDLILIDTSMNFVSLHHVNTDYIIILFYESDCGHCKKEIKALKDYYLTRSFSLEIFAVCTDSNLDLWKQYIIKENLTWINVNGTRSITPDYHNLYNISITPSLFLLDKTKIIRAKGLRSEQLIPFLEKYRETFPE